MSEQEWVGCAAAASKQQKRDNLKQKGTKDKKKTLWGVFDEEITVQHG